MNDNFQIEEDLASVLDQLSLSELYAWTELQLQPGSGAGFELRIFSLVLFFSKTQSMKHLENALALTEEWIKEANSEHASNARRSRILQDIIEQMNDRINDPQSAAVVKREALVLSALGIIAFEDFEKHGTIDHLNDAITHMERALLMATAALDQINRAECASTLSQFLESRIIETSSMEDLQRAVDCAELATWITSEDNPTWPRYLNNLGNVLMRRFDLLRDPMDLDLSIKNTTSALEASSKADPNHIVYICSLATRYGMQYEMNGSLLSMERAINLSSKALEAIGQVGNGHAESLKHTALLLHAQLLNSRSISTGLLNDISETISLSEQAVDAIPAGYPLKVQAKGELGTALGRRFEVTGSMGDLDRGIEILEEATQIASKSLISLPLWLSNLGTFLWLRYSRKKERTDIERAIEHLKRALSLVKGHSSRKAQPLCILADLLVQRFGWTKSLPDLDHATRLYKEAQENCAVIQVQARTFNSLSRVSFTRFLHTRERAEIDCAVENAEEALEVIPKNDPTRGGYFHDLGIVLETRYMASARVITAQNNPEGASELDSLASEMTQAYGTPMRCIGGDTQSLLDLTGALIAYQDSWACSNSPITVRIKSLLHTLGILPFRTLGRNPWKDLFPVCHQAIMLLSQLSPRFLRRSDQQHNLAQIVGLGTETAAVVLSGGDKGPYALGLLDLARNVMAGLLLDMREDISDLQRQYPELASEYLGVRDVLDVPESKSLQAPVTLSWEQHARRRQEKAHEFDRLLQSIRTKPGFHNFLQPPGTNDLLNSAKSGPIIVINMSMHRCDAILIRSTHIDTMPLELTLEEVDERARQLPSQGQSRSFDPKSMLAWLWETITCPVLKALGFNASINGEEWPHVWWIPTRSLVHFPLHAAGLHGKGTGETVLDRVISSYASSIKSLVTGRRHEARPPTETSRSRAVLVAMQETPCNKPLPGSGREIEELETLCEPLGLQAVKPPSLRNEVLQEIKECSVFHFAGHGHSQLQDPSESSLLLKDWQTAPLTVSDIRDHKVFESRPFLAYLSACSTGSNGGEGLADESVHLINALQLSGFRHVVGTVWEVADHQCVDVARIFYSKLASSPIRDESVAVALHTAVRAIRDEAIELQQTPRNTTVSTMNHLVYYRWIPYIHFGV